MRFMFRYREILKTDNLQKYLLFLLILVLPFTHKEQFSIFDPDLIWSKFVLVLAATLGFGLFVKNFKKYKHDRFFILLNLFLVFNALSIIQSKDTMSTFRYILFLAAVTYAYPLIREVFNRADSIKSVLNMYLLSFTLVFAFLLVQMFLQGNYQIAIGGVWPVFGYPTRFGSTFWDVNHFGAYLASLLLFILSG